VTTPALTVQLVVRNMERWLPTALDSLRAQTRRDFEVVAVDDDSTDATAAILQRAPGLELRYVHTSGMRLGATRNLAIDSARGAVVATLDGDDAWLPWYVERVLAQFESQPSADIVSTEMFLALEDDLTTDRYYADSGDLRWFEEDQLLHMLRTNFIAPNHAVRRCVFDALGGYDPDLQVCEDQDLWVRSFASGFRAVYEAHPCAVYRLRSDSTVSSRTRLVRGRVAVLERAVASLPDGAAAMAAATELVEQRRQLDIAEGKAALAVGDYRRARRHFGRVVLARGASPRERAFSLAVATSPRSGQRMLDRRATAPAAATAAEARKARE
jgi:GT2 family glycosyltransferase